MNFDCLSRETLLVSVLRSYAVKTYAFFSICDAYELVEIVSELYTYHVIIIINFICINR